MLLASEKMADASKLTTPHDTGWQLSGSPAGATKPSTQAQMRSLVPPECGTSSTCRSLHGRRDGDGVGDNVGAEVGALDVGARDGHDVVGVSVGLDVGLTVGWLVGNSVGDTEGAWDGAVVGLKGTHADGSPSAAVSAMYSWIVVSLLLRQSSASESQPQYPKDIGPPAVLRIVSRPLAIDSSKQGV